MARNMNIAADCADCCTCPTPYFERAEATGTASYGQAFSRYPDVDGFPPGPYYTSLTISGIAKRANCSGLGSCATEYEDWPGDTLTRDPGGGTRSGTDPGTNAEKCSSNIYTGGIPDCDRPTPNCSTGLTWDTFYNLYDLKRGDDAIWNCANPVIVSLGGLMDDEFFLDEAMTPGLSPFGLGTYTAYAASSFFSSEVSFNANSSGNTIQCNVVAVRYRVRFPITALAKDRPPRIRWEERWVPAAGVAITSVELFSPGVSRPTVTISAPPAGGTQARAVAIMSSTGTVTGIRVLNPGSGYLLAPTVVLETAINGGTTSSGWVATMSGGSVASIARVGGSAGNYLPTVAITDAGGGAGATVSVAMDADGGLTSATLTAPGAAYSWQTVLTVTAKTASATAPSILLHFGTETAMDETWDGVIPPGYNPADPATFPTIPSGGYYQLVMEDENGNGTVGNLRVVCE